MFLQPKKVKTDKHFITRQGGLKISKQHIDNLNRQIVKDCKRAEQRYAYKGD